MFTFMMRLGHHVIGCGASPKAVSLSKTIIPLLGSDLPFFVASTPQPLIHKPEQVRILVNAGNKDIALPGGQVIVVLGRTGSGKTTLLNSLITTKGSNQLIVPFCEPEGDLVMTESLLSVVGSVIQDLIQKNGYKYTPFQGETAAEVPLYTERELIDRMPAASEIGVVSIDSLRKFFYSESKSTGTGGVNNEMFILLTELSVFAHHTGLTFIITLNPLIEDDEKLRGLASRVAGSVDTLITLYGSPADTGILTGELTSRFMPSRKTHNISVATKQIIRSAQEADRLEETIKLSVVGGQSELSSIISNYGRSKE